MQQTYFTPIKTLQQSYQQKLFNSDSVHREGDWVCLNCQNLNYSFRKKCNRCKTQSREENEAHSVYSYYYYPNNKVEQPLVFSANEQIRTGEKELSSLYEDHQYHHHHEATTNHLVEFIIGDNSSEENKENINTNQFANTVLQTPKKKKTQFQTASKLDGLPSVSPLIKRYNQKQQHTTVQKRNQYLHTMLGVKQSPTKNLNYQLPDVIVRDFHNLIHDFDGSPSKVFEDDNQCFGLSKDIEDSIARIII